MPSQILLNGLGAFLMYFVTSIILLVLFLLMYIWRTRHDEWQLIRSNNTAAAVAFSGSMLGFCLPLASAIAHSSSLIDCTVWGLIALVIQMLTYESLLFFQRDLPERITRGELAFGIWLAAVSLAVGLLNAACMIG
jgi:putative membrane protein